jgi:hypothetical protein
LKQIKAVQPNNWKTPKKKKRRNDGRRKEERTKKLENGWADGLGEMIENERVN